MLAPTLLIGLGGTGSKIVTKVAGLATPEQRTRLGFAVFDTDINELRDVQRENSFVKTVQTSTRQLVGEYLEIDQHARDSWFPVHSILNNKALTEGAGQVRAISRLAFDSAVRLGKLEPLHEAIQGLYQVEEGQSQQALRVIIVSSLAGGTGSGLVVPVALYVKNYLATRLRQGTNITRGFFILPEVFEEVIKGQEERNNLRSNAYATLRELDAFIMKGDETLPEKFRDSVKIEFPRANSNQYEEYRIRPYDFCFLFDAQNAEGSKLSSFSQYLDHAANCIYAQSIGPMNKRSNSSEDNTIRKLCEEKGRNRYAGAGSSMLIYPLEEITEYIALNLAKDAVSDQWLQFDEDYKNMLIRNAKMRADGHRVADQNQTKLYIASVETLAKNKNPFAKNIINACNVMEEDGVTRKSDKWTDYVNALNAQINEDQSTGQSDLDSQQEQCQTSINDLGGGKDSWGDYAEVFFQLEKYKAMVIKRSEETAGFIAYTMFNSAATSSQKGNDKHRLETYLRDGSNEFMHPNAVRYFLYKTMELLETNRIKVGNSNKEILEKFESFEEETFNDPSTDVVEKAANLGDRKLGIMDKLMKRPSHEQLEIKNKLIGYLDSVDEYRVNSVLEMVLDEGVEYVKEISKAFETFYSSFETKVAQMSKRISTIVKKYKSLKVTTARYVCVSSKCFDALRENVGYAVPTNSIDSKLAEEIYNKVRKYATLHVKPKAGGYFSELFDEGIIGFYKKTIMNVNGSDIDIDVLSALEKEAMYEKELYDDAEIEQYVQDVITATRNLSCPFIEKPLGEERDPIFACAYNPKLNPKDSSPRSTLVEKMLANLGGVADDDISKNMILFYQSFYGLRANDLGKFAPPKYSSKKKREAGEYFKAYYELIAMINPESHNSKAITPHIDKWWHIVSKMPDLDDDNQKLQEQKIYAAFFWGMLSGYIDMFTENADTGVYRLNPDKLDMDDASTRLTVSNGTHCDQLYEVLDALTIYPELVEKILRRVEAQTEYDAEYSNTNSIKTCSLYESLESFTITEYPIGNDELTRSIFDLPLVMKKSITNNLYYEENMFNILKAQMSEIEKYLKRIYMEKEMPEAIRLIIIEQFDKYIHNIELEKHTYRDIYNDYLFSRTCSIITTTLEKYGLRSEAAYVKKTQENLRNG